MWGIIEIKRDEAPQNYGEETSRMALCEAEMTASPMTIVQKVPTEISS